MERRIRKLVELVKNDAGENPLVFLDTSAILDFEKEIKLWKLKDRANNTSLWYMNLEKGFPLFVTEGVMAEVTKHYTCNCIGGRPEISDETYGLIEKMHEKYCAFLREISMNPRDLEKVRYDSYWASILGVRDNEKKRDFDIVSSVDRKTVENAAWLRYALDKNGNPVTSSSVIGHDGHLSESIRVLTDKDMEICEKFGHLGYDNIKFVDSRY